jgi:hypothetical protein
VKVETLLYDALLCLLADDLHDLYPTVRTERRRTRPPVKRRR